MINDDAVPGHDRPSDTETLTGFVEEALREALQSAEHYRDRYRKLWIEAMLPTIEKWAMEQGAFTRDDFEKAGFCRGLSTPECRLLFREAIALGIISESSRNSILPYRVGGNPLFTNVKEC